MPKETIVLAADHGGFELKRALGQTLRDKGFDVLDCGTDSAESVDYPDFAERLVKAISTGRAARGVLMCGSGIGMSIAANRHAGIRAALVHDEETARLAREHNDANVLVMGGRLIPVDLARRILEIFLKTPFGGDRHARRVAKLG
jgi:ribose 5-phosphate isomerase B